MTFTVVKLGGCNGSGKTSVARALMKHVSCDGMTQGTFSGAAKSPNFYRVRYSGAEIYVLGSYESVCGGMDTISDKEQRLALLRAMCKPNRVIFYEGLITGKTYGAMGDLSEGHVKKGKGRWLYAFMDTPFEVCVERVLQRRAAAGNDGPFDPQRTMQPTYDSCDRLARKLRGEIALRDGSFLHPHPVHMVDHRQKPITAARKLLDRALELHHAR